VWRLKSIESRKGKMHKKIARLEKIRDQMHELNLLLEKHETENNKRDFVKTEKKLIGLVNKSISIIKKEALSSGNRG